MGKDPTSSFMAQMHIDEAQALTKKVREKLEGESEEIRKAVERFHNGLALFSSGTIALSITYLGYLKSIPNKAVMYPKTLIASWLVLFVCLVASLYSTFFSTNYLHFARLREFIEKLIHQKNTSLEELDNLLIVNLTQAERQVTKERFALEAKNFGKDKEWAKKREDIYTALWIWSGRLAQIAFPLGIALLMFFAIKNM